MVKGMRAQNPLPKYIVICAGLRPRPSPEANTTTVPTRAKTNASGNQRSVQSAIARPARTATGSRRTCDVELTAMVRASLRTV